MGKNLCTTVESLKLLQCEEEEVSSLGPPGSSPTEDNGGGDLVKTWCRLMCCTLAEIVSLISEQQRLEDRRRIWRSQRGT